jgi:hypothetical protein
MMPKRTGRRLLLLALALAMTSSSAQAGQRFSVSCQKRLSDSDIQADVRAYPQLESGFNVVRYKANHTGDGWSYGTCVLEARPIPLSRSTHTELLTSLRKRKSSSFWGPAFRQRN